jgi:hypothetical protein
VISERGTRIAAGTTVETNKLFSEVILTLSGLLSTPVVGEVVTGKTSGATGYVLWITDTKIGLRDVTGTFQSELVAGTTSGFTATASADIRLTKTDDAPYVEHVVKKHAVTSTGTTDPQTVYVDVNSTAAVEIYNASDADINVYLRSANVGEPYSVPSNSIREINELNGEVDCFILQFSAAGSCTVMELRR